MSSQRTRRRVLRGGALGLAAGLASCAVLGSIGRSPSTETASSRYGETAMETLTVPRGERRTLALPEAEALAPTYRTVTLTDRTGNGTIVRKEQDGVEYHTVAPSITVRDLGELPVYAVGDDSDLPE